MYGAPRFCTKAAGGAICGIWKLAEVCNGALGFRAAGLGYECHAGHTTKWDP